MANPDFFFSKHSAVSRLVLVPLTVSAAWILAVFFLGGSQSPFDPALQVELSAYTLFACVIAGIIIPLVLVKASLLAGDVNMFQIGFRSVRRTLLASGIMLGAVFLLIAATSGSPGDAKASFFAFIVVLPSAISDVVSRIDFTHITISAHS